MFAALFKLVEWFAKGGVTAWLIHAGLTVVVFSGLDILIGEGLSYAISAIGGLPSDVLNLALLAGVADFFNIVGAALLTRAALVTATQSLSLGRA
jgi:hypothetical protein